MASRLGLDDYRRREVAEVELIRATHALADGAERVLTVERIAELRRDVAAIAATLDVLAPVVPD